MGSENDLDKCGAIEVAELLLTADIYNRKENLTEDDLPPNIRKHYFDANTKSVKRPIYVTSSDVQKIYGIDNGIRCGREVVCQSEGSCQDQIQSRSCLLL